MGYLVPLACIDVLPGDTFISKVNMLARVAPLEKPVMHPVEIRVHNWFVPNRIIWDDWEDFIVGNEGGATYPTLSAANATEAALLDHMGIEPVTGVSVDALPVRAYNLIFNEWYRDQDLVTARTIDTSDGADTTTTLGLAQIAWPKDYFTTARANPQQGSAVQLGFSSGTVGVDGIAMGTDPSNPWGTLTAYGGASVNYDGDGYRIAADEHPGTGSMDQLYIKGAGANGPDVSVDLSNATGGIDINELRNAIALQRIAEAREFFGSRYVDYLRWYGINPRDGRLDRPEYLGGGKQTIAFSEVLSMAEGATVGVGDLFGHGIAGVRQKPLRKMFEEHGWFISLMSVRPKGIYQNGIPKRFLRTAPTDFWHRELELMPWQEVNELEIYGAGSSANVFGYAPRYDEYRETQSFVSGTFRGGTEEDWTLAREFGAAPTLNSSFVTCAPSDRIYQDASQPEILATARIGIKARRLVSANTRISSRAGL